MRILFIFILVVLIASCSSIKNQQNSSPVFKHNSINALELAGAITTDFPELNQTFDFNIKLAAYDSVSMTIYGPFGLALGKLFATEKYFLFYNTLNNEIFEGTPSQKNLKMAMNLPLSFNDLISVLRCEAAEPPETFAADSSYDKENRLLFKSIRKEYIDYALIDAGNMMIVQYQRKLMDGKILMTISNNNFEQKDNVLLPADVQIKFPVVNGSVTINYRDKQINPEFSKPFRFNIPSSAKINRFD